MVVDSATGQMKQKIKYSDWGFRDYPGGDTSEPSVPDLTNLPNKCSPRNRVIRACLELIYFGIIYL